MEVLNHRTFYDMIISGAQEIIYHQNELNAINVFPVADGDTGNNLAHLMGMITRDCMWGDSSKDTLERIKLACMRGSRGNSGMIFSQFIITMCNFLLLYPEVKYKQFLEMCELSVQSAIKSVAAPQEGTVLTVMKTWVRVMKEASRGTESIQQVLKQSLAEVNTALEHTKNQLEVLRVHNVVDAGAKGFVHFLKGLIEVRLQPKPFNGSSSANLTLEEKPHVFAEHEEIPFRYCSEFLFETATDPEALKGQLSDLGDSLVIVSDNGLAKVHLHTNDPARAARIFSDMGKLVYQKVEDMHRQYQGIYQRKSSIALVVDSACDLPQEWMDAYQIHMLPLQLQVGKSTFLDKVTLQPDVFYTMLEESTEQPKSSQPNLLSVEQLYQQLLQQYESVVSIHLSKELSGTYNVCCMAAEQIDSARIHVVNSRTLSGAYGLLACRIAEALETGSSFSEIKHAIKGWIPKSEILVSVPTLKYMLRGGRVSPLQGKIARWLSMKPIVSIDHEGKSLLYGKTFFSKSSQGKMFQLLKRIHLKHGIAQYALLHAGNPESMKQCELEMINITGSRPLYITNVSPVIGANAGKGAISVAMLLNENNTRGGV
ncbi:DegV family EDD domain-containing protein [Paenibacillus psychroresistens]|uniref:DegV family EDD domain-containing protein n=1 Tax=Paenibacillus psychroresistens TaxID=1778678 RepID=A0A6B8RRW8_9BACL|nr:DegV family protein [Paenibacillus psychroresistens]QGQ98699.1 DegV family EDD domain-containing protein [Paenibacillus psychroresistens]